MMSPIVDLGRTSMPKRWPVLELERRQ